MLLSAEDAPAAATAASTRQEVTRHPILPQGSMKVLIYAKRMCQQILLKK